MSFLSKLGSSIGSVLSSTGIPIVKDIGTGLQSFSDQTTAEDQLKNEQNFNAGQAQINRDFQREERLQTQEFNQEMWERNNEYNSPKQQLARAQEAGINPNLIADSMGRSVSNPVTSSPMSGSMASSSASIASGLLMHQAQIANMNAQTRKANSDADINEQEYAYNNVTFSDRVNSLQLANDETKARLNKIVADTDLQKQLYEFLAHKNEEELKLLRQQFEKTTQEIKNLNKQGNLIDSQVQGQGIQNSLANLQLQFSKESGIPQGTDVSEAVWKTLVNGNGGDLIDIFIENVEDAQKRTFKHSMKYLEKGARSIVGNDIVDGVKGYGKLLHDNLKKNGIRAFFGGTTPPPSLRNP